MEQRNRFIAPGRIGAWLIVTLGTATAALVISVWGVLESRTSYSVLQVELLKFDQRVKSVEAAPKLAMPSPAMPAPDMPMDAK